jgi:hypothetical protein
VAVPVDSRTCAALPTVNNDPATSSEADGQCFKVISIDEFNDLVAGVTMEFIESASGAAVVKKNRGLALRAFCLQPGPPVAAKLFVFPGRLRLA